MKRFLATKENKAQRVKSVNRVQIESLFSDSEEDWKSENKIKVNVKRKSYENWRKMLINSFSRMFEYYQLGPEEKLYIMTQPIPEEIGVINLKIVRK